MLKKSASVLGGMEQTKKYLWMTKEKWESVTMEMPEYAYVDPVMYQKCADKLGMAYQTFWKWYNIWYAQGKNTKALPFIKTEAEIRERDKRGNREDTVDLRDLPKIQWGN